jgi:hypothetical protein
MPQDKHELGDRPIAPEYAALMNTVAETLDDLFNGEDKRRGALKRTGFVLLVFPFEAPKGCNFISNGPNRWDIVRLFKEVIARWEKAN